VQSGSEFAIISLNNNTKGEARVNAEIVVAGHICVDLTPAIPAGHAHSLGELLVAGTLVRVGQCVVSSGGAVANTGIALHRIGVPVALMGKAGDDAFGEILDGLMSAAGCAGAVRRVPGEETSYTIVLAPPGIDRVFLHNPGANDTYTAADIDYDVVRHAKLFHFGYPPLMKAMIANEGDELVRVFAHAKQCGVTTALDMALPDVNASEGSINWEAVLRKVLPYVDIFVPSAEEVLLCLDRAAFLAKRAEAQARGGTILELIEPDDYSRLGARLIELGAGIATLKCGAHGMYVRTAGAERLAALGCARPRAYAEWARRELWQPPFYVEKVASATGAGDCAIAGFLASVLRGESLAEALAFANAAGAQNVQTYDATSGIRPYAETRAALASWPRAACTITAPGWRFDGALQTWRGPHDGA